MKQMSHRAPAAAQSLEAGYGPGHAGTFRRAATEADLVVCPAARFGHASYSTQIPAPFFPCLAA